jgi:hypothetical protein
MQYHFWAEMNILELFGTCFDSENNIVCSVLAHILFFLFCSRIQYLVLAFPSGSRHVMFYRERLPISRQPLRKGPVFRVYVCVCVCV